MASRASARAARIDTDDLCPGCMGERGRAASCPACGWIEGVNAVSPVHLAPRTILHGQYMLGRALGQGGFGVTYLAWDLHLEMRVAIKEFLPTDWVTRASGEVRVIPYGEGGRENFEYGLDSFETEARTLARFFAQPGVVPVLNYFRENGTGYIVMHFLEGCTLMDRLHEAGDRIDAAEALAHLAQVLVTLTVIHDAGLLHRDISPDNIYVCSSGRVCLLDFGAARHAMRQRSRNLSVQFKVGYTPEEQFRGDGDQGPWTDVYATAATFYRAVTGVTPPSALERLQKDSLESPSRLRTSLSPAVEAAIMRALAVRGSHRFRSAADFARALGLDLAAIRRPLSAPPARPPASTPATPTAHDWRQYLQNSLDWSLRVARDLGTAIQSRTAALARQSPARTSDREIRQRLGAIWPLIVVDLTLRAPHMPAGPDHGPFDVYDREQTREVAFDVTLQNALAGLAVLHGPLEVRYLDPRGRVSRGADSPPTASFVLPLDLVDRTTSSGAWRGDSRGFTPGLWRIELWWEGRKIGDRGFIVSE
jgi:serine/threonine protein kinase